MKHDCFCCGKDWPEVVMHYKRFPEFDMEFWICPNCEQAANIIKRNLVKMVASGQVGAKFVEVNNDVECDCPVCRAEREEELTCLNFETREKIVKSTPKPKGKKVNLQWED